MKNRSFVLGLVLAAVGAVAASAYAGVKIHNPVVVNAAGRTAYGSMADARASSDANQSIGCYIAQNSGTAESVFGGCSAQDASGNNVYCYFPSAAISGFAKVIAATNANTYYYFQWDASGACTYVYSNAQSVYGPLTP